MDTGNRTYYELGSWKFCCWQCGRTDRKSSQAYKNWQGFYTCDLCWEMRNQQDLIRAVPDPVAPPWVQRCGPCCGTCGDTPPTRVLDSEFVDETSLG